MKISNELFILIESLSKSEKRHFKLFASKHTIGEQNNYVKLFDAIDKQTEYDENAIEKKFKGQSFAKRLSSEKVYLYNLILKSLRVFHTGKTVEQQVNEHLIDVQILFEKDLLSQCWKTVNKASTIVEDYSLHSLVPEINRWKKTLTNRNPAIINGKTVDEIYNNEHNTISILEKENELWRLYNKVQHIIYSGAIELRTEQEKEEISKLYQSPVLQTDYKLLSIRAKGYYHYIRASYFYSRSQIDKTLKELTIQLSLAENTPYYMEANYKEYVSLLTTMSIMSLKGRLFKDFEAINTKLTNFYSSQSTTLKNELRCLVQIHNYKLQYYILSGQFSEALLLAEKTIEPTMEKLKTLVMPFYRIHLHYHLAYLNVITGNFDKAVDYLNILFNNNNIQSRSDMHCMARIMDLIVHYELKNEELLPYKIKATYRFLHKMERYYNLEDKILNFIRKKLDKPMSQKELIASFQQLKDDLEPLLKNTLDTKAFELFDIISWLDSKIRRKTFAEVLKEKAAQTI